MSSFKAVGYLALVCLVQNAVSQCYGGYNPVVNYPSGPYGPAYGPTGPAYNPNGPAYAPNLGGYGGSGVGNVAITGELPVGGTTVITGQVPVVGAVEFEGPACAAGSVTIAGNCACNFGPGPLLY